MNNWPVLGQRQRTFFSCHFKKGNQNTFQKLRIGDGWNLRGFSTFHGRSLHQFGILGLYPFGHLRCCEGRHPSAAIRGALRGHVSHGPPESNWIKFVAKSRKAKLPVASSTSGGAGKLFVSPSLVAGRCWGPHPTCFWNELLAMFDGLPRN